MSTDPLKNLNSAIEGIVAVAVDRALAERGISAASIVENAVAKAMATRGAVAEKAHSADDRLTTAEAMALLRVTARNTIVAYEKQGRLKPVSVIGKRKLYRRADVEALRDGKAEAA